MKHLIFAILLISLFGCLEAKKVPKENGIQWHKKGMTSALAQAVKEDRPLFVYWGAEWCPPCNVIKSTVFKDVGFIESTKKYISVYLDGDTESAQEWGEKLKASGYPTLMILDAKGKEVVRLSSGRSSADLAESLDWVFYNLKPIDQIIADVLKSPSKSIDPKTWRMLSNYSWGQAKKLDLKLDWAKIYSQLEAKVPVDMAEEKSRFYLSSLVAEIDALKEEARLPKVKINKARATLNKILSSSEETKKHLMTLAYYSQDFAKNLYSKGDAARAKFIERYRSAMAQARVSPELSLNSKLISYYPILDLTKVDDKETKLAAEDQKLISEEVPKLYQEIKGEHEQVFVSSKVSYILSDAGLKDRAREILLKDIKTSKTPYYSMSSLASLEKKLENKEEALKWIERAYNSASGHATRLQWGSRYLSYLFELAPKEEERIIGELQKYYREHLKQPDAFMARNKSVLNRLAKKLKEWGKDKKRRAYLVSLKERWLSRCETKSASKTEFYREACTKYFKELVL